MFTCPLSPSLKGFRNCRSYNFLILSIYISTRNFLHFLHLQLLSFLSTFLQSTTKILINLQVLTTLTISNVQIYSFYLSLVYHLQFTSKNQDLKIYNFSSKMNVDYTVGCVIKLTFLNFLLLF